MSLDPPIFDVQERESFASNPYVQPYSFITKRQLEGLLGALGEYQARVPRDPEAFARRFSNHPELPKIFRALISFSRRPRNTNVGASSSQLVFDAEERSTLAKGKYHRGTEDLTKQDLIVLLETLERFSLLAPGIEQIASLFSSPVRAVHAHNALISFRDKPFTEEEFRLSVYAVVAGQSSLLTTASRPLRFVTLTFEQLSDL